MRNPVAQVPSEIVDALDPGGSGDMYAGLSAEEAGRPWQRYGYGVPAQVMVRCAADRQWLHRRMVDDR